MLGSTEGAGEPARIRTCPLAGEKGEAYFLAEPVLDLRHVDSVAVAPADSGLRQVFVRLTEEGRERFRGSPLIESIGIVLDGEVVARYDLRIPGLVDRLVVLSRAPPDRAEWVAGRLRAETARASEP